jgi:hypothetical protein
MDPAGRSPYDELVPGGDCCSIVAKPSGGVDVQYENSVYLGGNNIWIEMDEHGGREPPHGPEVNAQRVAYVRAAI